MRNFSKQTVINLAVGGWRLAVGGLVLAALSACGGGGGGSPAAAPSVSAVITAQTATAVLSASQTAQITTVSVSSSGDTEFSLANGSTVAGSATVGSMLGVQAGVDTRFPFGFAGRVSAVSTNAAGASVVTLTPVTFAEVVAKSSVQASEVALGSDNFLGAITPQAVKANAAAPLTLAVWQSGKSDMNGGLLIIDKPDGWQKIAASFLGDKGSIDAGEIKLSAEIKIADMVDDISRLSKYGAGADAKVAVTGNLKNLKLTQSHEFETTLGVTSGLKSLDFRVTGDMDAEVKITGGFNAEFGYFSKAWTEVEKSSSEKLGVPAKLTGLDSKDKIGKYPIAGLVFSIPTPLGTVIPKGQSQTPIRAASAGGVIIWVYFNANGTLTLEGATGVRVNGGKLVMGLEKKANSGLDMVFNVDKLESSKPLLEMPFVDGEVKLQARLGPALAADFFAFGVRVSSAELFLGGQLNDTLKAKATYSTRSLDGPWAWEGSLCNSASIGGGAIISSISNFGVELDTKWTKPISINRPYKYQFPTEENIAKEGKQSVLGVPVWFTSAAKRTCYPQPVVTTVSQSRVGSATVQFAVSGNHLPTDLSLTLAAAGACTRLSMVSHSPERVVFACAAASNASSFNFSLSSASAQNLDTSSISGVSSYAPTQTASIAQLLDNVGSTQGAIANNASTDDNTPSLVGALSAALTSGQSVRIHDGASTVLGLASVSGVTWSFTASALATGSHTLTAVVITADGVEGARSAPRLVTVISTITTAMPLPDLVPSLVSVSPASVAPGGGVSVSWRITNSGNGNAKASSTGIRLLPAATSGNGGAANALLSVTTGALASGSVANQSQAITIPANTAPGSYVLVVVADNVANSSLGQSNTSNDFPRSAVFSVVSSVGSSTIVLQNEFSTTSDLAGWEFTLPYNSTYKTTDYSMLGGILKLEMLQTDKGGFVLSPNFTQGDKTRLTLLHYMHPGNYIFLPSIWLTNETTSPTSTSPGERLEVKFHRSGYAPDQACSSYDVPGISESRGCILATRQSSTTSTSLYDRWITTVITYNSITGEIEVDYENDGILDFVGTVSIANRFKVSRIAIGTYGWYTGHYHSVDSVKVENLP